MNFKLPFLLLSAVGPLACPVSASADVTMQFGESVGIGIRDCAVAPGCSDENNLPPLAFQQINAPNLPATYLDTTGFSAHDASLAVGPAGQQTFWNGADAADFGTPTIHAAVYAMDGRISDGGWVLQSYTWDGSGSTTRNIGGTLTYSTSGGFPNPGGGGFNAGISVFTTGASSAVLLESQGCGFGGLTFDQGYNCIQNANVLASNLVSLFDPAASGTYDLKIPTITLDSPNETIFVLTTLIGWAKTGGYAEASHTFVTTFDSTTGLTPAATVPEPGTVPLLSLGLAGLCFLRHRWRSVRSAYRGPSGVEFLRSDP